MADADPKRSTEDPTVEEPPPAPAVQEQIGRKAERMLKARGERHRGIWFGLGMFGLVGWSIAVPTLAGVAFGLWLDRRLHDRISWTLTMLFIGLGIGCLNAWFWVRRESGND